MPPRERVTEKLKSFAEASGRMRESRREGAVTEIKSLGENDRKEGLEAVMEALLRRVCVALSFTRSCFFTLSWLQIAP